MGCRQYQLIQDFLHHPSRCSNSHCPVSDNTTIPSYHLRLGLFSPLLKPVAVCYASWLAFFWQVSYYTSVVAHTTSIFVGTLQRHKSSTIGIGQANEVFHIVLQEAPCSVLQLFVLRRFWRPRLVATLTLPLLSLGDDALKYSLNVSLRWKMFWDFDTCCTPFSCLPETFSW